MREILLKSWCGDNYLDLFDAPFTIIDSNQGGAVLIVITVSNILANKATTRL